MATIRTVFSLTDNVSSSLLRITNTAGLLDTKLNKLKSQISDVPNVIDNLIPKVDKLNTNTTRLVRTLVGISSAIAIFGNPMNVIGIYIGRINALVQEYQDAVQGETMLTTVMRQRMTVTRDSVQSILDMANAMEKTGIYEADMIVAGAQELATYVSEVETLKTLIPAMTDLVAQRKGYVATSGDFVSVATMMGKVMQGMTSSLQRVGYVFTEDEKKILETGNEMERAAMLAQIITQNVGPMNKALASTDMGNIAQMGNRVNAVKESLGEAFADTKRQFMAFRANIYELIENPFVNAINKMNLNLNTLVKTITLVGTVAVAVGLAVTGAWLVMHWHVALVISAVILLIRIFSGLGIEVGNVFSVLTGLISGFVGLVTAAFDIVYNVIAAIYNFIVDIIADIGTLITHPWNALRSIMIDVIQVVLNVARIIAGVIEIFTGGDLSSTIKGWIDELESIKTDIWGDTERGGLPNVKRMEYTNITQVMDYVQRGYSFGEILNKMINESFKSEDLNNVFSFNSNGGLVVTDSATVQLVDEMKELLARKALEEYIVRINQVTPQMTIENIAISERADADEVITLIADSYEEMVNANVNSGVLYG